MRFQQKCRHGKIVSVGHAIVCKACGNIRLAVEAIKEGWGNKNGN